MADDKKDESEKAKKVDVLVRITPEEKQMLDCLQRLYNVAGLKFSMSRIVGNSITFLYRTAYLSQKNVVWEFLFRLFNAVEPDPGVSDSMKQILSLVKEKKHVVEEILEVKVNMKEKLLKEFEKLFEPVFRIFSKKKRGE